MVKASKVEDSSVMVNANKTASGSHYVNVKY